MDAFSQALVFTLVYLQEEQQPLSFVSLNSTLLEKP